MAIAVIFAGLWLSFSLAALLPNRSVPAVQGSGTVTPEYPQPIFTAQDAVSRTLEFRPDAHSTVARIVDFGTVNAWLGGATMGSHEYAPVWLVGVLEDNLTVNEIAAELPAFPRGGTQAGQRYVQGAYYVWDANGGHLKALGALDESTPQSYSSIQAMQSLPLTPVPATELPPVPRPTGGPEDL